MLAMSRITDIRNSLAARGSPANRAAARPSSGSQPSPTQAYEDLRRLITSTVRERITISAMLTSPRMQRSGPSGSIASRGNHTRTDLRKVDERIEILMRIQERHIRSVL